MLGITPPLSTSVSSNEEVTLTYALIKSLKNQGAYESPRKEELRKHVLKTLDTITKNCVKKLSKNMSTTGNAIVMTYGSYAIGVYGRNADIDTLCVLPFYIKRSLFFNEMAKALNADPDAKNVVVIANAMVPLLKFKYAGISVDLICTSLNLDSIPEDLDVRDTSLLENLELTCVRSLNGVRVASDILSLVPNYDTFSVALRAVKLWASLRGIYSNTLGFFGGVAWAILVGRVCQLYPNATASTILSKFFNIMSKWNWPLPVMLCHIENHEKFGMVPWNRVSLKKKIAKLDLIHIMPIITPSYPSMCTTHNVTKSTMAIIVGELKYAAETMDRIMYGAAPWSELFNPRDFFTAYPHYLRLVVSSQSLGDLLSLSGYVESRLRGLVSSLEKEPSIAMAHPFSDTHQDTVQCNTAKDLAKAIGTKPTSIHSRFPFDITIHSKALYIGLYFRYKTSGKEREKRKRRSHFFLILLGSEHARVDLTHRVNGFKHKMMQSEYMKNGTCWLTVESLTR
ncbi:Poly(A) polymerase [Hesseltinella vesiculosa]|uniref:Poly(A) polymerase n=1 Tax=Hesseltinella vesiculosa TaxID=101127 RepID=A0A1X2G746_9FUNG|nr:Poly(A) polymerase [Hesseltinella vesiculosa]